MRTDKDLMISKQLLALFCFFAAISSRADLLDLYANLTGKTVLMSSALRLAPDNALSDVPSDKSTAIAKIENELSEQGIAVLQDGPHFVIVFPERQRNFLTNAPLRGAALAAQTSPETMRAGAVNFINTELGQVLAIYSDISRRTILRPFVLPAPTVRLKSTCPLSRAEVVYALATVFALNGIAVVEDGEKFAQVVATAQRSLVTLRAPRPEPTAKLLDPNQVMATGNFDLPHPVSQMERDLERWRKALYEFLHYQGAPDRSAQRLLALYASLAGKTAELSNAFDGIPIWFHVNTPISKSELMYAIETTFHLNRLALVEADDQRVRLERSDSGNAGPMPARASIPELISRLSDPNFDTRFNAGMALVRLGTNAAPALPAIERLLKTEPQKFHDVMLKVVENCGAAAQSIKPTLQQCLTNPNVNLRMSCARTLWVLDQSNAEASRAVARNCLRETDAGVRIEAASLLWRMDNDAKEVLPTLAGLLSDPERAYDFRAVKLLGEIGPRAKEAAPALRRWLDSNRDQPAFAITAGVETLKRISSEPGTR